MKARHVFAIIGVLFVSMLTMSFSNDKQQKEVVNLEDTYTIQVVDNLTGATTLLKVGDQQMANDVINIYLQKDDMKFISRTFDQSKMETTSTYLLKDNKILYLKVSSNLQYITKEQAEELGITKSATKICSEWKNCCRTCHDNGLYYVECSDDRGCPDN